MLKKRSNAASALLLVSIVGVLLVFHAATAHASEDDSVTVAQEDQPYQPPEFVEVNLPSWAEPFEPLARLPLWAQAALVSAAIAGVAFVLPAASRWVWTLGEDSERIREPDE